MGPALFVWPARAELVRKLMLTESDFIAAAAELAKLNSISEDQAADYLAKIGDTPEMAEDGRVIVRNDGGAEIARVICLAE